MCPIAKQNILSYRLDQGPICDSSSGRQRLWIKVSPRRRQGITGFITQVQNEEISKDPNGLTQLIQFAQASEDPFVKLQADFLCVSSRIGQVQKACFKSQS